MTQGPCDVAACVKQARNAGYCATHYARSRNGKPLDAPIREYNRGSVRERSTLLINEGFTPWVREVHARAESVEGD